MRSCSMSMTDTPLPTTDAQLQMRRPDQTDRPAEVDAAIAPAPLPRLERALRWFGHQRWLRYGVRKRVLEFMRDPQRAPPTHFEVPFAGFVYPGRMNRLLDWIVCYYGAYELDELELMRSLLSNRTQPVALDVGANVGHHSLYLASFCAHVHSFEPYEAVAVCLDEKIHRNHLQHIQLHRVGLSDRDQQLEYFAPQGINTGTGSFVATHDPLNNRLAGRLTLVHADSYLAALDLQAVDLVKIDVEGFETTVLRGLQATLSRYRPFVMLELSDLARREFADIDAFMALFPPGYEAKLVRSQRHVFGLLGRPGCALEPLRWHHDPTPGGYVNLLLRPQVH